MAKDDHAEDDGENCLEVTDDLVGEGARLAEDQVVGDVNSKREEAGNKDVADDDVGPMESVERGDVVEDGAKDEPAEGSCDRRARLESGAHADSDERRRVVQELVGIASERSLQARREVLRRNLRRSKVGALRRVSQDTHGAEHGHDGVCGPDDVSLDVVHGRDRLRIPKLSGRSER